MSIPVNDAQSGSTAPLLSVTGLTKRYGGVVAVNKLDFSLPAGQVLGVIGPNGAGKSTLLSLLSGAVRCTEGTIVFNGREVTGMDPAARARSGIGRTYQVPRPFLNMSVEENLLVPLYAKTPFARRGGIRQQLGALLERAGLQDFSRTRAADLPLYRRKRLELARALALKPRLLLLDEVASGLDAMEIDGLIGLIRDVARDIDGIIIVEHVQEVVRACCSTAMVMNFGERFALGLAAEVLSSDDVAAIYLGAPGAQRNRRKLPATPAFAPGSSSRHREPGQRRGGLAALVDARDIAPPGVAPAVLLELKDVCAGYGQAGVLHDVNLSAQAGRVTAILGANGAGKTALCRVIAGALPPVSGRVLFDRQDITGLGPHAITAMGIAQCMEGRRIFPALSVEENLLVAARGVSRADRQERLETVYGSFPILGERRRHPGTAMSDGQQQMLAIGRALMGRPRMVVFDEISLGLAPAMVDRLYEVLASLRQAGLGMLLVEQDVERAMELADVVHVVQHGRIVLSGGPSQVRDEVRLRDLYMGSSAGGRGAGCGMPLATENSEVI